jgi:alanyl-tRNA synthetase
MNIELNEHNKKEYPPMHTAEHILNQTMVQIFGCPRSRNTHIERKKSKCDYYLDEVPTDAQVIEIEEKVNEIISKNLQVTEDFAHIEEAGDLVDLSKLPDDVSETLRIIRVGDYDVCACIGSHVENTSEIGQFYITTHSFDEGRWRVRFKLREA